MKTTLALIGALVLPLGGGTDKQELEIQKLQKEVRNLRAIVSVKAGEMAEKGAEVRITFATIAREDFPPVTAEMPTTF